MTSESGDSASGSNPKSVKLSDILFDNVESPPLDKKQGNLFHMYKKGKLDEKILYSQEPRCKTLKIVNKPGNIESRDDFDVVSQAAQNIESPTKIAASLSTGSLIVSNRQQGNAVVDLIKNVRRIYGDIEPDFIMSRTSCALFLSLRYHNAKPNYIHGRIRDLKSSYELRVLLVLVDENNSAAVIRDLCKLCIANNVTMVLAWSDEEVARYLESYKMFENKPPDLLMGERMRPMSSDGVSEKEDEASKMIQFLSSITSVNKTDARTLIENFGTIEAIMRADFEQLKSCSGIGALKARKIYDLFRKSFVRNHSGAQDNDDEVQ